MGRIYDIASSIYQKGLNRFSFLRKRRFEYTYKKNKGFGDAEYHMRIAADVMNNIPEGRYNSALDMGCGLGLAAAKLSEKIPSVTGVDISETAISQARKNGTNVNFVRHDIIDYCEGRYDLILCVGILPYIPEEYAQKVARNISAMLAPGGTLVIFEKEAYTGTRIEKYFACWKYSASKKNVKIAGEDFLMWIMQS